MPYLSTAEKSFFAENGYLVRHDLVSREQIDRAVDALWTGIDADRTCPETWINAKARSPIPGNHPAIRSTIVDAPVGAVMKELVGPELVVAEGPNPAMVYPTGDDNWSPPGGHLDGYYTPNNSMAEGTVKHNAVCATLYLAERRAPRRLFHRLARIPPEGDRIFQDPLAAQHPGRLAARRHGDRRGGADRRSRRYGLHLARFNVPLRFEELQQTDPHGIARPLHPPRRQRHPLRNPRRSVGGLGGNRRMRLTCSPTVCPELNLPAALDFVGKAGFRRIELYRDYTACTPVEDDYTVPMVRDELDARGVELTGFNIRPLTGRKADSDERDLPYNIRQVEWDILLGRALRLTSVNLRGGAPTDEALVDLVFGVNQLLETLPDMVLNLGNARGTRLEGLGDFQTVLTHLHDRAHVLLNTGQLLSAGEKPAAFAEALAGRIGRVHLRDQQGDKPVPFGQGDLALLELLEVLRQAGYDGELVVELEGVDWDEPLAATIAAREYVESLL